MFLIELCLYILSGRSEMLRQFINLLQKQNMNESSFQDESNNFYCSKKSIEQLLNPFFPVKYQTITRSSNNVEPLFMLLN